jgi:hypothetical protein
MAGLVPAIRSGTSLRQMDDWVAARDEWVASIGMKPIVLSIQRITPLLAIPDAHGHMPELHFV